MRRMHLDLIGITLMAALVLFLAVFTPESTLLRALIGIPLALYGVGYAAGVALFPSPRLGTPERFLLSLGLSLSILILTGLVLNKLTIELQSENWAWALFMICIASASLGIFRRWLEPVPAGFDESAQTLSNVRQSQAAGIRKWLTNPLIVVMVSLSILTVIVSAGLAIQPAPAKAYQGYSMFWMAPDHPGASQQVELGVRSMEFSIQSYRIELYAGGKLVQQWDDIKLEPKQEWTIQLELGDYRGTKGPVEAFLYRTDQAKTPYRQVRLWPSTGLNTSISNGQ